MLKVDTHVRGSRLCTDNPVRILSVLTLQPCQDRETTAAIVSNTQERPYQM